MKKIILVFDPGTVNFGWAALKIVRGIPVPLECGMLKPCIKDLVAPTQDDTAAYSLAVAALLERFNPTVLICERYSTRIRGTTGEAVNLMLGVASLMFLQNYAKGVISLVMPMTWKAAIKKHLGGAIPPFYKKVGIKDHPIDACLLAGYWLYKQRGVWFNPDLYAKQIKAAYVK